MAHSWLMVWIPTKETEQQFHLEGRLTEVVPKPKKDKAQNPKKKTSKSSHDNKAFQPDFSPPDSTLTKNDASNNDFVGYASLEDALNDVINTLKVSMVTYKRSADDSYILASFELPRTKVELCLISLQQHGIGNNDYTSVSVVPSQIHLQRERPSSKQLKSNESTPNPVAKAEKLRESRRLEQRIEKFYESIKSRMLVAEVVERIRAGGDFTFDFLMLLFLAGCIAFMGLIENSSVNLVASMLVSPLMGPILSGIFGAVIRDKQLRNEGIGHELIALLLCITIGLIFGLVICWWVEPYGITLWPTPEMLGRGQIRSLYVGVLVAIPSGAGVALSVLGGNSGSLVGVAISASLLPPAVNCGLFFAIAIVSACSENPNYLIGYSLPGENSTLPVYEPQYSNNLSAEAAILGIISFTLTLVNIACIIMTGVIILKVKEVTPDKIPQAFANFWKKDIKEHRKFVEGLSKDEDIPESLLREAREVLGIDDDESSSTLDAIEDNFLATVFGKASQENQRLHIKDWVAAPLAPVDIIVTPAEGPNEVPEEAPTVNPIPMSRRHTLTGQMLDFGGFVANHDHHAGGSLHAQAEFIRMNRQLSHFTPLPE